VADLKYATLATVSRCGMIWFSEEVISTEMLFEHFVGRLQSQPLNTEIGRARVLEIQNQCAQCIQMHLVSDGLVSVSLDFALTRLDHIMDVTPLRLLATFFSMMDFSIKQVLDYDSNHSDFSLSVILFSIEIVAPMKNYIIFSPSNWKISLLVQC
jgi:dynein heavy chain 1